MSEERSYGGYTLADLERICRARAERGTKRSANTRGNAGQPYAIIAMLVLPFLVARIKQLLNDQPDVQ